MMIIIIKIIIIIIVIIIQMISRTLVKPYRENFTAEYLIDHALSNCWPCSPYK